MNHTIEAAEGGAKVTTTGERPDGTPINGGFTVKYDGKDYPVTDAPFDSIAIKQVDANRFTFRTNKVGKVFSRGKATVSGNTLTITSKGTNAEGKPSNDIEVYDKQ
jgi:hypothetical protein